MSKKAKYLDELKQIMTENGGMLRPEDVLEYAKDPTTNLHDAFTWDDSIAANAWRKHQARQLIRVSMEFLPIDPPTKYKVFLSLKEDTMDMETFLQKYDTLKELAGVFAEMQKVIKKKSGARKRKYKQAQATA